MHRRGWNSEDCAASFGLRGRDVYGVTGTGSPVSESDLNYSNNLRVTIEIAGIDSLDKLLRHFDDLLLSRCKNQHKIVLVN